MPGYVRPTILAESDDDDGLPPRIDIKAGRHAAVEHAGTSLAAYGTAAYTAGGRFRRSLINKPASSSNGLGKSVAAADAALSVPSLLPRGVPLASGAPGPEVSGVAASGTYVPSDISLGGGGSPRVGVITGPNAGGKSTAVRMVATMAILAQVRVISIYRCVIGWIMTDGAPVRRSVATCPQTP
jgi:hypothetical protein